MRKTLPFILSAAVIILDQISKALIVHYVPEGTVAATFFNDFLWICHVRNDAVAFSIGAGLPEIVKYIIFIGLPLVIMVLLSVAVVSDRILGPVSSFQRWCLAGIIGGGTGNLIDRIFRSLRVVDWISTNNYGWFGMERFPTYNIADAAIVVSVILLVLSIIRGGIKNDIKEN